MSKPKLLLINCATLLCLEHREGVATSPSNELVNSIINSLPLPEGTVDVDHGRQIFLDLRSLVLWLNSRTDENFPSETEILQQIQVACREETYLFEALNNTLKEEHSNVASVVKLIQSYRVNLEEHLNDENIVARVKEINHRLMFRRDRVASVVDEVRAMKELLEPLLEKRSKKKHPAMTGSMDFSDQETLTQYFQDVKTTLSADGALKSGWQALNRMLGSVGAFKRGESCLIGALQHNFKSGFMLCLFVHFCLFNKPSLRDPTKRPLLLFISFENEIADNLLTIYEYLKENETGEPVVRSEVDIVEASQYVSEQLRQTGWEVKMERFDPSDFTYASLIGFLEGLIADGYEIAALLIDYMNMMSKSGIETKVAGDDVRLLFRRIRNFTTPRGITYITPHQLSTDAQQLTRDNVEDFVQKVANKGFYDGCRRLGQEPDLEIMLHIVLENGSKYLTSHRGKHRNTVTPERDQYMVLPFKPVGTIPWDIDKEDSSVSAPGGGVVGSDEEIPWWQQ